MIGYIFKLLFNNNNNNNIEIMLVRCYYQMTKNLIETQHSFLSSFHYYFSCLIFIYCFYRTVFVEFVIYYGFDNMLTHYNLFEHDILLSYLSTTPDALLFIIVYFFAIFYIYCEHTLYWLDTTITETWHWLYQIVVMSQDRYYQSMLPVDAVENIKSKRIELLMKRFLFSVNILPKCIVRFFYHQWVRLHIWYHMDNIDRRRLFEKSLSILPNISVRLQSQIILLLIFGDKFAYCVQWFICK